MTIIESIILGIVEGLTEFLPVSSTGHMMIAQNLMGMESSKFVNNFTIIIQLGAILSVVLVYYKRFFDFKNKNSLAYRWGLSGWNLYKLMIIGALPAAIIGVLLDDYIDTLLNSTWIVVIMLFLGGIVMLWMEKKFENKDEKKITEKQAFAIGFYQCLAMIPGTSRSMVSIMGAMERGLSRRQAAEFSFFLAVPTMVGATLLKVYSMIKDELMLQELMDNMANLIVGSVVAFVVALLAIKFFISYVSKYGFKVFGIYRIIISILLGGLMLMGIIPFSLS